jgi:hypothetical protein
MLIESSYLVREPCNRFTTIYYKIKLFFFSGAVTVLTFFTKFLRKKFKGSSSSQAIWYGSRATGYYKKLYMTFYGDHENLFEDDLEILRGISTSRQDFGKKNCCFLFFFASK